MVRSEGLDEGRKLARELRRVGGAVAARMEEDLVLEEPARLSQLKEGRSEEEDGDGC